MKCNLDYVAEFLTLSINFWLLGKKRGELASTHPHFRLHNGLFPLSWFRVRSLTSKESI
jgi:hypothetical protein